jgi:hypothetical protein
MAKQHPTALDLVCSSQEAAAIIGVSKERIAQLCAADALKCRRLGRDWLILLESAAAYAAIPRRPGPKSNGDKGLGNPAKSVKARQ